jgi:hypothetical protein
VLLPSSVILAGKNIFGVGSGEWGCGSGFHWLIALPYKKRGINFTPIPKEGTR